MPTDDLLSASVRGHKDFSRLWAGLAISQFGSAIGMVALPVVAVILLKASTFQVAVLAATTSVTIALLAFPMGNVVEHRRKRPVMIGADLLRFSSLITVPIAGLLDVLTFAHLCVAAALTALGQIAFQSASQAHLKALVGPDRIVDATGRLESTQWLNLTVGPSLGGLLIGLLGALGTLVVDAVSFLVSAGAIYRLREPEPEPVVSPTGTSRRKELLAGLLFAARHPTLRWVLPSWLAFAGSVAMAAPVAIVFYLSDLNFNALQYGLLLGLPSLGGFIGARLARPMSARFGVLRTLRLASLARGPWQFLIPLAVPGPVGLVMCLVGTFGVLFFAAMANTTMAGYRAIITPDHLMVRVSTLWSFTTTVGQPLFILVGGLLASQVGNRATLYVAAALMIASSLLLLPASIPFSARQRPRPESAD
ncbi:MAG: MFS transporter [Candidatus Limnocylindria bacterium]